MLKAGSLTTPFWRVVNSKFTEIMPNKKPNLSVGHYVWRSMSQTIATIIQRKTEPYITELIL